MTPTAILFRPIFFVMSVILSSSRCSTQACATFLHSKRKVLSGSGSFFAQSSARYASASPSPSLDREDRKQALHDSLKKIGISHTELEDANLEVLSNPTSGYDDRFGRSAIRTYRSFLKSKAPLDDDTQLSAAAGRCAQNIEFLIKRHKSHLTEWVRHHDADASERTVFPLVLVLDNLRSAYNVGSLFRTADAAGCKMVLTSGITPHPNGSGSDKVRKSALGAEGLVESRHFDSTKQAVEFLRTEYPSMQIMAMETTEKSESYTNVNFDQEHGVALILGNEVTGVDTELLSEMDKIIEIPTFGAKNSLNVASCAPVVLFEVLRQWKA